jgi:hypothetical protein
MFFTVGDSSTLHQNEGDYNPRPLWTSAYKLNGGYTGVCFKVVLRSMD